MLDGSGRRARTSPRGVKEPLNPPVGRLTAGGKSNGSEDDIRACVTERKVSGGTTSAAGRTARDVLLGPMKTCRKLGVSFFRHLGHRPHVPGAATVPPLPDLVRLAASAA